MPLPDYMKERQRSKSRGSEGYFYPDNKGNSIKLGAVDHDGVCSTICGGEQIFTDV